MANGESAEADTKTNPRRAQRAIPFESQRVTQFGWLVSCCKELRTEFTVIIMAERFGLLDVLDRPEFEPAVRVAK